MTLANKRAVDWQTEIRVTVRMTRWTAASIKRNELTKAMEPIQPFFLYALAKRLSCTVFLDIGANVGAYSILFAETEAIGQIHAFEPSPDAFNELTTNIEQNGLGGKITPHQIAVSDRAGKASFGIVDGLSGCNSIAQTSIHANFNSTIEVRTACLDDLLSLSGQSICVKLDIEGHEPAAIAGMTRLMRENSILLQVEEWGDHHLPELLTGSNQISQIGHDGYFTNMHCPPETVVSAMEEASERLIGDNLAELERSWAAISPIKKRIGDLELRLNGKTASFVRRLKSTLFNTPNGGPPIR